MVVEEAAAVEARSEHGDRADDRGDDRWPVPGADGRDENPKPEDHEEEAEHRVQGEPHRRAAQDRPDHVLGDAAEVLGRVRPGMVFRNDDEQVGGHAEQELRDQRDHGCEIRLPQLARHRLVGSHEC